MQCCSTDLSKIALKFTDKRPIFIDVSVNGRAFANAADKSARQALRQIYRQTIFGYFHHNREIVMHTKKPDQICNWLQIWSVFSIWDRVFSQPFFEFGVRVVCHYWPFFETSIHLSRSGLGSSRVLSCWRFDKTFTWKRFVVLKINHLEKK